jgi:hypothetical protein
MMFMPLRRHSALRRWTDGWFPAGPHQTKLAGGPHQDFPRWQAAGVR